MMACFWLELQFNIAEKQITHNVVGMPHGNISGKASVCKRYIFKRVDWYVTRYHRVCNEKKIYLCDHVVQSGWTLNWLILEIRLRYLLLIIKLWQVNCNIFLFTTDSLIHISLDTVVCVVIWELCHKHYRILQQILYSSFSFSEKLKKDILENIKYYYTFAIYIVV